MGKNSEFNKNREKQILVKFHDILQELPAYTKDFLNEKADQNPGTALEYARDLTSFFEYLEEYCPMLRGFPRKEIPLEELEKLSFQDVNEFQNYLDARHPEISGKKEHELSKVSIARKMSALRGFFNYLCTHDYIRHDPTRGAMKQRIKSEEHAIIRLSTDEVHDYLSVIKNSAVSSPTQKKIIQHTRLRDYAILYLLLNTGLRVSECVALDINDLNFKENSLLVVRKGKKEQLIYYNDEVQLALLDYIENERPNYASDDEPALFLSTQRRRMGVRAIQKMVKKYAEEIGTNKNITPHKMRSTYGTALYNQTGDIRLVADVLGHSNVNTTVKHYAAIEEEHRKIAAKIKPYKEEEPCPN